MMLLSSCARSLTFTCFLIAAAYAAVADDTKLAPKEAGARYGQALGAIEICHGSKLTSKAEALARSFADKDLETFKTAAAETFQTWVKAKNCVNQRDPNMCKIIMDQSCFRAAAEIGQGGSVAEGLVEFAKY